MRISDGSSDVCSSDRLFAAEEADDVGRSFRALRLVRDYAKQNLGLMLTRVDHPWLDREATVLGVDHNWRPTAKWNIQTRLVGSEIDHQGASVRGSGRSEEHTSELQSLMRISYAVFCLQ